MEQLKSIVRRKPRLVLAAAVGLILIIAGMSILLHNRTEPSTARTSNGLQVLDGFDTTRAEKLLASTWSYMPGVTPQADKRLAVKRTGLALLSFADNDHPDVTNSSYLPNPPVNTYGAHLELASPNVGLATHISNMNGVATVSLISAPPIRYDERIVRQPGIDITIDGVTVTIRRYMPTRPAGAAPQISTLTLPAASPSADISLMQRATKLTINVNGRQVSMDGALFTSQVWFGLDTTGSFTVDGLSAYPVAGSKLQVNDTSKASYGGVTMTADGLIGSAKAAGRDQLIGTAVDLPVLMQDPNYASFIVQNFNEIETELLAKFQALQPEQGNYQFAELDALVNFAAQHGLTVHGHALIFGEAYPKWLQQKLATGSKQQAEQLLQDHIRTVVSRYDGRHGHGQIKYWDVVNEPLSADDPTQLATYNLWYKAIGPDYIKDAFVAARAAYPAGQYGINENGMEVDPARADALYRIVQSTNADTKLIDYVGYQAHFDEDTLQDESAMALFYGDALTGQFSRYAAAQVAVRISEATVATNDDEAIKSKIYGRLLTDCLRAANCSGFNFWGATNNSGLYFYNTANIVEKDPGDDAPTSQSGTGPIVTGAVWQALLAAARTRFN